MVYTHHPVSYHFRQNDDYLRNLQQNTQRLTNVNIDYIPNDPQTGEWTWEKKISFGIYGIVFVMFITIIVACIVL